MGSVKVKQSGDFSAALRQISNNLKTQIVRVGIFANATTKDGKLIAEYAAYNEYGTEHIPPRPFMRNTIKEHKAEWQQTFGNWMRGRDPQDPLAVERALYVVGDQAKGHVQETIGSNMPPPNAASTIRQKRKVITGADNKPMKNEKGEVMTHVPGTLVMNGDMQRAVAFEVNPK